LISVAGWLNISNMKETNQSLAQKTSLMAAKKVRQAKAYALLRSGQKTQESMFLIQPSTFQEIKVTHCVLSFD
jgi:hypothetical protein